MCEVMSHSSWRIPKCVTKEGQVRQVPDCAVSANVERWERVLRMVSSLRRDQSCSEKAGEVQVCSKSARSSSLAAELAALSLRMISLGSNYR